ncbi:MAG: ABC transporter permease [Euryarchaeota archaeon]|jgi:putative spermidine/putrescine transport system permease protein/spermidine/putrescine transport system permease protein|nr:ABC transporter permease [Euryarchaeota archaeon]
MNIVTNNHLEGVNSKALAKARRKEGRLFFNLSLPSLITILIVVFIPVFWLSSLSFFDRAGDFSWENYDRIFQSQLYIKTFIVTLKISFITLFFCILLGYPLCYWLSQLPDRLAGILMVFVLLPFWTSILVRTYAWLVILQRNGIINDTLISIGWIDEPLQLAHNLTGTVIGMVHILLPFFILPLFASMRSIDTNFIRAAISLGSTPRGAFWRVFFKMSLPGFFAGTVLVFVLALGTYVTPVLLGGGKIQMLAQRIDSTIMLYSNWGAASALGVVLLILAFATIWIFNRAFGIDKLFMR